MVSSWPSSNQQYCFDLLKLFFIANTITNHSHYSTIIHRISTPKDDPECTTRSESSNRTPITPPYLSLSYVFLLVILISSRTCYYPFLRLNLRPNGNPSAQHCNFGSLTTKFRACNILPISASQHSPWRFTLDIDPNSIQELLNH